VSLVGGFYRGALRPLLFGLDAERAHSLTLGGLAVAQSSRMARAALRATLGVDGDDIGTSSGNILLVARSDPA